MRMVLCYTLGRQDKTILGNRRRWKYYGSNSSARAIRKTALRANYGFRHCFAHLRALRRSGYQSPDFYAGINPSPDTRSLNCYRKGMVLWLEKIIEEEI